MSTVTTALDAPYTVAIHSQTFVGVPANTTSIAFAPSVSSYVGVCSGSATTSFNEYFSVDGIAWTERVIPIPAPGGTVLQVIDCPFLSKFICVGYSQSLTHSFVASRSYGKSSSWAFQTFTNITLRGACCSSNVLCIYGLSEILRTTDGTTWTNVSKYGLHTMCYSAQNNEFLGGGSQSRTEPIRPVWNRFLPNGTGADTVHAVSRIESDAGCAAVGYSSSNSLGYLSRYTNAGVLSWRANFSALATTNMGMCSLDDASVIVATSFNGSTSIFNANGTTFSSRIRTSLEDILIIKYSSSGSVLWVNRVSSAGNETVHRVVQTSDNGFILAGRSTSPTVSVITATNSTTGQVVNAGSFIMKFDQNGNYQWMMTFGTVSRLSMATFADGSIVVGASTGSSTGSNTVSRILSNGSLAWSSQLTGVDITDMCAVDADTMSDLPAWICIVGDRKATTNTLSYSSFTYPLAQSAYVLICRLDTGHSFSAASVPGSIECISRTGDHGILVQGFTGNGGVAENLTDIPSRSSNITLLSASIFSLKYDLRALLAKSAVLHTLPQSYNPPSKYIMASYCKKDDTTYIGMNQNAAFTPYGFTTLTPSGQDAYLFKYDNQCSEYVLRSSNGVAWEFDLTYSFNDVPTNIAWSQNANKYVAVMGTNKTQVSVGEIVNTGVPNIGVNGFLRQWGYVSVPASSPSPVMNGDVYMNSKPTLIWSADCQCLFVYVPNQSNTNTTYSLYYTFDTNTWFRANTPTNLLDGGTAYNPATHKLLFMFKNGQYATTGSLI